MNHSFFFLLEKVSVWQPVTLHNHLSMASVSMLPWQFGCYEIILSEDLAVADVTWCCSPK